MPEAGNNWRSEKKCVVCDSTFAPHPNWSVKTCSARCKLVHLERLLEAHRLLGAPRSTISSIKKEMRDVRRSLEADSPRVARKPDTGMASTLYTEDESEFLKAVAAFRSEHGRAPTLAEGFQLARALGWEKVA